jgi:hypothetical protein
MAMRKQEIEELIRLVEESKITELEVSQGRTRIRISKNGGAFPMAHFSAPLIRRRWKTTKKLRPRASWHQT